MWFAEIWESDRLPQELRDMILQYAIPRRLNIRHHHLRPSDGAPFIEAVDLADWAVLIELLEHSNVVRETTLRVLKADTTLILTNPQPQRFRQDTITNQSEINSKDAAKMIRVPSTLLPNFGHVEVTTPYIMSFGRGPDDGFNNNMMIRCTVRCQLPSPDREELDYDTTWQINASSCKIYETRALNWLMEYVEEGVADHNIWLEEDLAGTSKVDAFLAAADQLAIELEPWHMDGQLHSWLYQGEDEWEYLCRLATRRHVQFDYESAGQEHSAWSSEWYNIKWEDVSRMATEKRERAPFEMEEEFRNAEANGTCDWIGKSSGHAGREIMKTNEGLEISGYDTEG